MSRKLICDFCFDEFPDHDADVDASKTLNWVEHLDKVNDVCAECAMMVVHNLVEHGGLSVETIRDFHKGDFTRKVAFVNPPKVAPTPPVDPDLLKTEDPPKKGLTFQQILNGGLPDLLEKYKQEKETGPSRPRQGLLPGEEDLDFEPDDFPLEPPSDPTGFDPPDVFHLTMHGAGLNPEHELLFHTLDEAKDYAAKNAQVFPEASYFLQCPDGTELKGDNSVSWSTGTPPEPTDFRITWRVASQPKKP